MTEKEVASILNFAGGRPAASHFSCLAKKSNQKKLPPVCRPSGSLDQPQASGAAQLALTGRTPRALLRNSNSARLPLRLLTTDRGGAQGKGKQRYGVRFAHVFILLPA